MADVLPAGPVKKRGRPPTNSSELDEATLKARRQRNREAQNVFRKRRQAAEVAQSKRLGRLEEIVEEMSSIFMNFVDEMLASETVSQQPELVSSLRGSMKRVLDLAQEVVGPDDTNTSTVEVAAAPAVANDSTMTPSSAPISQPTPTHQQSNVDSKLTPPSSLSTSPEPPGLSSTASNTSEESTEGDFQFGNDAIHHFCTTSRSLNLPAPPGMPEHIPDPELPNDDSSSMKVIGHPHQFYGNGWTVSNHPIVDENMSEYWGPRVAISRDSFAYRLAKASLINAFNILSQSEAPPPPPSEEHRLVGTTLNERNREDLLVRLRWLLGSGGDYIYRVVDLPYGQHGDQIFTRSDLNPAFDELGWPSITKAVKDDHNGTARYFSILGVERQLLSLGGRFVDTETLELNIPNPAVATSPSEPESPGSASAQPDSWSFVNFYSPKQPRTESPVMTLRLSTSLLVSNLAQGAVCLMRGPGYPRDTLGAAIQASVVKVGP
ncbi:hypothetical protein BGZ63DRAFT_60513 [Mariannaea sp. PMI_226]|nr:hypothetical protein BGZ63DRAFT_60513 [Mariannaea sp. PMI_226]